MVNNDVSTLLRSLSSRYENKIMLTYRCIKREKQWDKMLKNMKLLKRGV